MLIISSPDAAHVMLVILPVRFNPLPDLKMSRSLTMMPTRRDTRQPRTFATYSRKWVRSTWPPTPYQSSATASRKTSRPPRCWRCFKSVRACCNRPSIICDGLWIRLEVGKITCYTWRRSVQSIFPYIQLSMALLQLWLYCNYPCFSLVKVKGFPSCRNWTSFAPTSPESFGLSTRAKKASLSTSS